MTPRQARLGVDLFTGLVIASVGLALAGLTWRLQGASDVAPAAAPVIAGGGDVADIGPVLALAPFGSAAAAPSAGGDGPIRLRAIFLAVPATASTVLIAGADGKVASYGLGQSVGGGVIEAISAEQIVLRTSAGARTIGFADPGSTIGALASAAGTGQPAAGIAPAAGTGGAPQQPSSSPAPSARVSGADAVRALIPAELQGRNARAPAPVTPAPVTLAPVSRSGTSGGYVVGASPGAAVLAAGVRPGDVIERVNGRAVGAGTSERDLVAQATAAGSARLDILRGGQRVSLTVPVR